MNPRLLLLVPAVAFAVFASRVKEEEKPETFVLKPFTLPAIGKTVFVAGIEKDGDRVVELPPNAECLRKGVSEEYPHMDVVEFEGTTYFVDRRSLSPRKR